MCLFSKKGLAAYAVCVCVFTASWCWADTVLSSGFLVTDEPNGVAATYQWRSDYSAATNDGFKIAWTITQTANVSFPVHYRYEITNASGGDLLKDLSHIIIQVSGNFTCDDISPGATPHTYVSSGNSGSNPNMPAPVFGIKFTPTTDAEKAQFVIEFDSTRGPVLGNFYAKDGNAGPVTAWNTGLSDPENGMFIMRPDGKFSPAIPLPGALWAGLGLMSMVALRRVRAAV